MVLETDATLKKNLYVSEDGQKILISDGNLEIGAHVRSNYCSLASE